MKIFIIERFAVIFHAGKKAQTSSDDIKEYKEIEVSQEFVDDLFPANYIGLDKAYYVKPENPDKQDMFLFESLYFFDESYFETIKLKYKDIHETLDEEYARYYAVYNILAQYNR